MARSKVAVLTDSTAFLPQDLLDQYEIGVIPLNLHWNEESLLDGVDITPTAFYERLPREDELPTTSQPSAGRFLKFFNEAQETADSIVGIFISSELSGTIASAHAAVEMMEDYPIEIVDSRSASLGLGLIVLAAARAAEEGRSYKEVAALARKLVPNTRVLLVVDTLDYLHKGGRIGGAQRFLGSMVSIKPVLKLEDGKIEPLASVRTKRKAVERMLDEAAEELGGGGELHMAVIDAAAPEEGEHLYRQIRERFEPVELIRGVLSPTIGAHVGPGTVGVAYYDAAVLKE